MPGAELTPDEAAALLRPDDTLGDPARPGPAARLPGGARRRDDWTDLRIGGALLLAWSEAYTHPNVHLLSGFFGPLERALRDQGANIGFTPGRLPALRAAARAAAPAGDGDRRHAARRGRLVQPLAARGRHLRRARARRRRPRSAARGRGLASASRAPSACRPSTATRSTSTRSTSSSPSDATPFALARARAGRRSTRRSPSTRARFIPDGATLQTGIGDDPVGDRRPARRGRRRRLRRPLGDVHRRADEAAPGGQGDATARASSTASRSPPSPAARRSSTPGSTATTQVAFLPVEVVNSPDLIGRNRLDGDDQRRARGRPPRPGRRRHDRRRCSTRASAATRTSSPGRRWRSRTARCSACRRPTRAGGELRSRIVPGFGAGAVVTTPRHQVDVIVTEHGAAELQGLTVHQRGVALAEIAHPDFRDELRRRRRARLGRPLAGRLSHRRRSRAPESSGRPPTSPSSSPSRRRPARARRASSRWRAARSPRARCGPAPRAPCRP